MKAAEKAFLSTDLVGQTYLYTLVASRLQLLCTRIEKANCTEKLIFGVTATIRARDAAPLPVRFFFPNPFNGGIFYLFALLTVPEPSRAERYQRNPTFVKPDAAYFSAAVSVDLLRSERNFRLTELE